MDIEFHSALENWSISELVSILRTAFRAEVFDKVEVALVAKEVKMKMEIENKNRECKLLRSEYEFLRLDKIAYESSIRQLKIDPKESVELKETCEKLKKSEEDLQAVKELVFRVNEDRELAHEKGKKALEQYEILLENVKKTEEDSKKIMEELNRMNSEALEQYEKLLVEVMKADEDKKKAIEELNSKNSELQYAKSSVELELEDWKKKYKELGHRVSRLENIYTILKNGETVASDKFFEYGALPCYDKELVGKKERKGTVLDQIENQTCKQECEVYHL